MNLKQIIMLIIIFFIPIYWAYIQNLDTSNWLSLIGVLLWVVVVMFQLYEWVHEERTIRLKHSIDLYKELKRRADSQVVFNSDKEDLKLYINLNIDKSPDKFDDEDYSDEVNSHLEDANYKKIRCITEKRDIYIKLHNQELHDFLKKLNLELINKLQNTFKISEWNRESQPPPKKYFTKDLPLEIGTQIRYRIERERQSLFLNYDYNTYSISLNSLLVKSNNKTEIDEIGAMIIESFDKAINSNSFDLLKIHLKNSRIYHNLFKNEILKIKKDIDSNIPLNGNCNQCLR